MFYICAERNIPGAPDKLSTLTIHLISEEICNDQMESRQTSAASYLAFRTNYATRGNYMAADKEKPASYRQESRRRDFYISSIRSSIVCATILSKPGTREVSPSEMEERYASPVSIRIPN